MEFFPSVKDRPNFQVTLDSGIVIDYPQQLDGGGLEQKFYFLKFINEFGAKKKYNRCLEWCAGFAGIGFELLGNNICEHLSLTDVFPLAIETCNKTVDDNNLNARVSCYLSGDIGQVEVSEPWDLVVANPPHHFDKDQYIRSILEFGGHQSVDELEDLDVGIRLTVDDNYQIHREFFKNIGSRLTEDAEMFISEVGRPTMIEDLAKKNGFKIVSWYDMTIKNLNMLHLKR